MDLFTIILVSSIIILLLIINIPNFVEVNNGVNSGRRHRLQINFLLLDAPKIWYYQGIGEQQLIGSKQDREDVYYSNDATRIVQYVIVGKWIRHRRTVFIKLFERRTVGIHLVTKKVIECLE